MSVSKTIDQMRVVSIARRVAAIKCFAGADAFVNFVLRGFLPHLFWTVPMGDNITRAWFLSQAREVG